MSASTRVEHGDTDAWSSETELRSPRQVKRRRAGSLEHSTRESGLMRNDGELPRFIGSGSGIHFIRTVYSALAQSTHGSRAYGAEQPGDLVPGEDDQLPEQAAAVPPTPGFRARRPLWQPGETVPDGGSRQPDFDSMVDWTRNYFDNWHPAFPFLHGPEVLEILEQVASGGIDSVSETDIAIVRAIVSISLADSRQLGNIPEPIPASLVFYNQEDIASNVAFSLGSAASLKKIQAAVCVELFLISMLKFNMASRLGGVIVRMAFHLGLHRCPYRYSNFSPHQTQMRKRLWWSIYCMERMVCQSLGLPLDIRDDDVDVCYPDHELHGTPANVAEVKQLQLLALLSKHARLRGSILELRNKTLTVRHDTMGRALVVQAELTKWANDVHEIANGDAIDPVDQSLHNGDLSSAEDESISLSYRMLLEIMQYECTITLNRPLLASVQETPASKAALQACIGASRSIIDKIDSPRGQGFQSSTGQTASSILVWPLLTWSVWMSCFILTYAALDGATTAASAQRYTRKSLGILKQLSIRDTKWPDSCALAVERLVSALEQRRHETHYSVIQRPPTSSSDRDVQQPTRGRDGRRYDARETTPRVSTSTRPTAHNADAGMDSASSPWAPDEHWPIPQSSAAQTFQPRNALGQEISSNQLAVMGGQVAEDPFGQGWLDPLNAIDFSNFAQSGSSDSAFELPFY